MLNNIDESISIKSLLHEVCLDLTSCEIENDLGKAEIYNKIYNFLLMTKKFDVIQQVDNKDFSHHIKFIFEDDQGIYAIVIKITREHIHVLQHDKMTKYWLHEQVIKGLYEKFNTGV
jgi:hypothetical protein